MDIISGLIFLGVLISGMLLYEVIVFGKRADREREVMFANLEKLTKLAILQNNKFMAIEVVLMRMLDNASPEVARNIKIMLDIIGMERTKNESPKQEAK